MLSSKLLTIVFAFSCLTISHYAVALASDSPLDIVVQDDEGKLQSQRFHYQAAMKALASGNKQKAKEHRKHLGGYPLLQYFDYAELKGRLNTLPISEIEQFFDRYEDSRLKYALRAKLLAALAKENRWKTFLKFYQPRFKSTSMRCHHLYARVVNGDKAALKEADQLWNVGKSQPKACDKLFNRWERSAHKTQAIIWSRFDKALRNKKVSLARYLKKQLDPKNQAYANRYLDIYKQPILITERHQFREQNPQNRSIIAFGIRKLAYKKPKLAHEHWERYEAQQRFDKTTNRSIKLHIIRRLTRKDHTQEAARLLSYSHSLRETNLVEEVIRDHLKELDWVSVNASILMLPNEEQETERWLYWRARVQDEIGRQKDFPDSQTIYRQLAQKRNFYGFLAADLIKQPYALVDASSEVEQYKIDEIAAIPGIRRAYELWLLNENNDAKAEWYHASRNMSAENLLAAGQLAQDWGWHNSGIRAMIKGNLWDQLTVRFPIAYKEVVQNAAKKVNMDPIFIYAIARQESAFDVKAKSHAGAMGLMQLLPSTAKETAALAKIRHKRDKLYNAEHNITLGSHHLSTLLERFDNHRALAAAAYNAGAHRVKSWLTQSQSKRPVDVWIETIPFRETRGYVQNVLAFSVIYNYRLGNESQFLTDFEAKKLL